MWIGLPGNKGVIFSDLKSGEGFDDDQFAQDFFLESGIDLNEISQMQPVEEGM